MPFVLKQTAVTLYHSWRAFKNKQTLHFSGQIVTKEHSYNI